VFVSSRFLDSAYLRLATFAERISSFASLTESGFDTLWNMLDVDVTPVLLEVFSHQPSVAVVWLFFTAKEAGTVNEIAGDRAFDVTFVHQFQEALLVKRPVSLVLLVCVQYVLGRR
jgi:hypothetical protein